MLLLSLGFLFGASLVYSVLISNTNSKIRELTSFVAELRLDVDDLAGRRQGAPQASDLSDQNEQERVSP
jgi:hypothetical protein